FWRYVMTFPFLGESVCIGGKRSGTSPPKIGSVTLAPSTNSSTIASSPRKKTLAICCCNSGQVSRRESSLISIEEAPHRGFTKYGPEKEGGFKTDRSLL